MSAYGAPARRDDLSDLPPTWIGVGAQITRLHAVALPDIPGRYSQVAGPVVLMPPSTGMTTPVTYVVAREDR